MIVYIYTPISSKKSYFLVSNYTTPATYLLRGHSLLLYYVIPLKKGIHTRPVFSGVAIQQIGFQIKPTYRRQVGNDVTQYKDEVI